MIQNNIDTKSGYFGLCHCITGIQGLGLTINCIQVVRVSCFHSVILSQKLCLSQLGCCNTPRRYYHYHSVFVSQRHNHGASMAQCTVLQPHSIILQSIKEAPSGNVRVSHCESVTVLQCHNNTVSQCNSITESLFHSMTETFSSQSLVEFKQILWELWGGQGRTVHCNIVPVKWFHTHSGRYIFIGTDSK